MPIGIWSGTFEGDTIETAIPITIPGHYLGSTLGYNNNYDEACPYGDSTAPEVVFRVTPTEVMTIDIDLCYSSYDTKLYVYDEFANLIACNDDFHFGPPCYNGSSRLEDLELLGWGTYYIVVDGGGTAAGDFRLDLFRQPDDPDDPPGDTIETAIPLEIPGSWAGSTVDYNNNYDEACPYGGSTAPEVVFQVTPTEVMTVDIDLCYSSYDTKLYVYDESLNLLACNDDFHFGPPCYNGSSRLEDLELQGWSTYYIVVDGGGSAAGDFRLDVIHQPDDPDDPPGDTIETAIPLEIPGSWAGSTVDYNNNYDEACPYGGSTAPEVVFQVTPSEIMNVDIDLCYSSYDTKLYVYDQSLNLIACNDDFHFGPPCYNGSSRLEDLELQGWSTYYIVVDGGGSAAGDFQLDMTQVGTWTETLEGDTIETAIPIEIPGHYLGSTVGYNNNYDEACPYGGSVAPEMVFKVTPSAIMTVDIDLCYSSYDTKLYVYDQFLNLIACNDDFHFGPPCYDGSSRLEDLHLLAWATYYIVVDGGGTAAGDFRLDLYRQPDDPNGPPGDTILTAIPIEIPGTWNGTTIGYNNNYDEVCPYSGSTAPEVVYSATPAADIWVDIDLCYSSYDTKLYVYDENLNLVGCNDDFYFGAPCYTYSSKLEGIPMTAGVEYYIIVDGYGSSFGAYQLDIVEYCPCVIDIPGGYVQLEGEPELVDGYADAHNGGCNSPEFGNPFQPITHYVFAGKSGWYISSTGNETRDTDWFHIVMPYSGVLEVTGDAEYACYMFELAPQDCGTVAVAQQAIIGPCMENTLTIVGPPGSLVWFWVGPTTFSGPVNEFDYLLYSNIGGYITVENHSWTSVKALFR